MIEPEISIYDVVHVRAAIDRLVQREQRAAIALKVFRDGWRRMGTVWRPTEIEALMNLAGRNREGRHISTVVDIEWLSSDPVMDNYKLVGRVCPDCGRRLALTKEYWHENKDGKNGFHSICKRCRNGARTGYYARMNGGTVRAYKRQSLT